MIKVIKAGLYTSIQDLGRWNHTSQGVPVSGCMDLISAMLANNLVGNDQGVAVIEITLQGPVLQFLQKTTIAICGADLSAKLNDDRLLENEKAYEVNEGDTLQFGQRKNGARAYLSVIGGFKDEDVLGSQSYYPGITLRHLIEEEQLIGFGDNSVETSSSTKFDIPLTSDELEVMPGPEFDRLNPQQITFLFNNEFTLGSNNRMAYQLQEPLENDLTPIISSAVVPGTIQLTPSGKMIILMRDCQTTGGYPRILNLSWLSTNFLAQKVQLEKIRFIQKK